MKILILRFSSIGDIVLTSPVMRCLKTQLPDCEIHYATKKSFNTILENNPHISKIHLLENSLLDLVSDLKKEQFDVVIDLHNNLRTFLIKLQLNLKSFSVKKNNFKKWQLVNLKKKEIQIEHIVHRYMATVKPLKVAYDGEGLDYFIAEKDEMVLKQIPDEWKNKFWVYAIGGQFNTKKMPLEKMKTLIHGLTVPIILLGGKEDETNAVILIQENKNCISFCGKIKLNESAAIVKAATGIVSHDTGLMHIAAAYKKQIVSIWGNTTPQLGMYPFYPTNKKIKEWRMEVEGLECRPCSKIGHSECPKQHFNCMQMQPTEKIISILNEQM